MLSSRQREEKMDSPNCCQRLHFDVWQFVHFCFFGLFLLFFFCAASRLHNFWVQFDEKTGEKFSILTEKVAAIESLLKKAAATSMSEQCPLGPEPDAFEAEFPAANISDSSSFWSGVSCK